MKTKILTLFILLTFVVVSQNDCVYPELTKGTKWTLTSYNKKGKIESSSTNEIKEVSNVGARVDYRIAAKINDEKGKEVSDHEMTMSCEDGVFTMDLKELIPPGTMEAMQTMELQMSGDNIKYPSSMKTGETLPNSTVNLKAISNGMTLMDMTVTTFDRKVEAYETVTTPAGEFKAFKISSTTTARTRILNTTTSDIQWYAPGIGVVRVEYFDKKGRANGYSEMTEFKKG